MRETLRRGLAALLCSALVFPAPGLAPLARADEPAIDPKVAMDYFKKNGVLHDDKDELRHYLIADGKVTPLGMVMMKYLKVQANPGEEVEGMKDGLDALRKSGPYTPAKAKAMDETLERYKQKFAGIPPPTAGGGSSPEDTFKLGTLREAYMTNMAVIDPPKKAMTQIAMPEDRGWEFYDDEGLAFRLNKNQVTTYNRELQKQQRELNRTRPPQAPFIPETGRYNAQMIELSYHRLKLQLEELERAYHMDRVINMSELLGKQFKPDQYFKDPTLEKDLEAWAAKKTYTHNGRTYSVLDIVNTKTKNRRFYLDHAQEGTAQFKAAMEGLKGADTITDQKVSSMQMSEQYVLRYLSLTFLESQRFYVKNLAERVDPKSPDSQMINEAIKEAQMDPATRERYKKQVDGIRERLDRMMKVFATVQDNLAKSDYASSLDIVQAALNQSQKELQELSLDYTLFTEAPAGLLLTKSQTGSWTPEFNGSWRPDKWSWGLGRETWSKIGPSGHRGRMKEVEGYLPVYGQMAQLIADGKFKEARKLAMGMHPDAAQRQLDLGMSGSVKVNDALRVTGSLRASRETLERVAQVNKWVDTASSFIGWTVGMALGGPIIHRTLSAVSTGARSIGLNLIAEVTDHAARRVASLNPALENLRSNRLQGAMAPIVQYAEASMYRGINFAGRQAAFTTLSGVISGGFTMVGHWMDGAPVKVDLKVMKIGEGHSPFRDSGDAFVTGLTGGVHWANESFHPMLGYVGLPSSYWEGGRFAFAAQTLGEKGAVGSVTTFLQKAGVPMSEKIGLNALAAARGGAIPAFALGMADNIAKYALFSQGVGYVTEKIAWYATAYSPSLKGLTDDEAVERRVKVSRKWGQAAMESPAWLLIPVFPAKYEEAAAGYQRSVQGSREYLTSSDPAKRAELANAPDGATLKLISKPKVPFMQQLFNLSIKGQKQSDQSFMVTKDIKRLAIQAELIEHLGGKGAITSDVNALKLLEISKSDSKKQPKIGRLYNSDDVALVAREQFTAALKANPKLTELILAAEPGSTVKKFGVVTPAVQREVALTMHLEKAGGAKVSPQIAQYAAKILERYLKADHMQAPAETFLKSLRANTGETKPQTEAFDKAVKDTLIEVGKWREAVETGKSNESYVDVIGRLRKDAVKLGEAGTLTPKQVEVFKTWFDYVTAGEARFQAFNNVEATHGLVSEEIAALKRQYADSPGMQNLLQGFEKQLGAWKSSYPADQLGKAKVDAPGERRFKDLTASFEAQVSKMVEAGQITPAEQGALKGSLREIKASPWILHDSKGTALSGWRPGQFDALMTSLGNMAIQGRGGAPIREFIRLTTGGGKTLLTFEGLLPIAEADAAHHGMKVSFLTVQSNLEAQARLEFMALKKIGSKLEFDTYEGFKSQIAEAKTKGDKFVEKRWVLGDEMDGAALQAALSLGETTGKITRKTSLYTKIENLNTFMEGQLGRRDAEIGEQIKSQARQVQSLVDGLQSNTPQYKAARTASEKLLRSAEDLAGARTPEAKLRAREAVSLHMGELKLAMQPLGGEAMARFTTKGLALSLAADQMAELAGKKKPSAAKIEAKRGELLTLAREQLQTLSGEKGPQAKAARMATEQLIHKLKTAPAAELAGLTRETVKAQKTAVTGGSSLQGEGLATFEAAMARTTELLGLSRDAEGFRARSVRLQGEIKQVNLELKAAKGDKDAVRRLEARKESLQSELDIAKSAEKEFATSLVQQQNLLGLVKESPEARLLSLRNEARRIREVAEQRLQRAEKQLQGDKISADKRAALEAEVALAEKEISLARRFEADGLGRAQRLVERILELKQEGGAKNPKTEAKLANAERDLGQIKKNLSEGELKKLDAYGEEVGKLYDVGKRMAEVDGKILKAKSDGQSTSALQADLVKLGDEASLSQRALKALRQEALKAEKPGAAQLAQARKEFLQSGEELLTLIGGDKPGGDQQAQALLTRRRELLDAFAGEESGFYKLSRQMKQDAYSFARSMLLEKADDAPKRAVEKQEELVSEHVSALKAELEKLKAAPAQGENAAQLKTKAVSVLEGQIKAWEGRAKGEPAKAMETLGGAMDLSVSQQGERNALSKAFAKQKSTVEPGFATTFEATLSELARRETALGESLGGVTHRLKLTNEDALVRSMEKRIDGQSSAVGLGLTLGTQWVGNKLHNGFEHLKTAFGGEGHPTPFTPKVDQVGISRMYAWKMLKEVIKDPALPAATREMLVWELVPSVLWPRGATGKNNSYVRTEFLNMIRGYYDDPATIRIDNSSKEIYVIFNGQWANTMDTETRRFWELEYGTDLTLRYTHKSLSTIKDLTANKKARFISLSATAGEKYKQHLEEFGVSIGGTGSKAPENVELSMKHGEGPKTTTIADALVKIKLASQERVAFRPGELLVKDAAGKTRAPKEVVDYLEASGLAKKDALSMDLKAFPEGQVRDYFSGLRKLQTESTGLVVVSMPDTRMLKAVRNYLIKTGQLKQDEIAQVFSDSEWLRMNKPEARVSEQMNLDNMPSGKVKILLLDTRVGGRGLDLDFKGDRGNSKLDAFKGYTNYEMLVIDPQSMSAVHLLQAQGRIDMGRVLPGAKRNFGLVMDVKNVQKEAHFKNMVQEAELFVALRNDPQVKEFARQESARLKSNVEVDWALVDSYVKNFEARRVSELSSKPEVQDLAAAMGHKSVDAIVVREYLRRRVTAAEKTPEDIAWVDRYNLPERYERTVRDYLERKQTMVEEDQLRSSSVLQDRPITDPRLRWLDLLQRGH